LGYTLKIFTDNISTLNSMKSDSQAEIWIFDLPISVWYVTQVSIVWAYCTWWILTNFVMSMPMPARVGQKVSYCTFPYSVACTPHLLCRYTILYNIYRMVIWSS